MRVHARLNVIENSVLCPRTCRWQPVDHCALCAALAAFERREDEQIVDCRPEVASLADTVGRLARA